MKYLKTFENNENSIYTITEDNPYGENYTYIFNSYKKVCNFMIYTIYDTLHEKNMDYDDFENTCNFEDVDELLEYYNYIDNIDFKYTLNVFNINDFQDIKFEDWMIERIEAKKYNL